MGYTMDKPLSEIIARKLCELDGEDPGHRPPFDNGLPGYKPPRWMLYEHIAWEVIGVLAEAYPVDPSVTDTSPPSAE